MVEPPDFSDTDVKTQAKIIALFTARVSASAMGTCSMTNSQSV